MKFGNFKMNLQKKIFVLMLSVGVAAFIFMGIVAITGMYMVNNKINNAGQQMSENTSGFTEQFAEDQIKTSLSIQAMEKAELVQQKLENAMEDVVYMADVMMRIMKHPGNYQPRSLPNPHESEVKSGQAYLNFSTDMAQRYGYGASARERSLASNIADTLEPLANLYPALFFGSKNGYLIAADVTKNGEVKQFSQQFLEHYDPREMGWYKLAAEKREPAFTSFYVDSNGNGCVTCVAPCYDDGELVGVIGLDCNPEAIFQLADRRGVKTQKRNKLYRRSFIMEQATGKVLFSSYDESSILAVKKEATDLRNCTEPSIARAATEMADGRESVMTVTVDGTDCYLAFAPIPKVGWSYGILSKKSETVYPALYAKENVLRQMKDFAESIHDSFFSILKGMVLLLLLLLGALFLISSKVARRFVEPILEVVSGVREIAQGNLDKKIEMKRDDEIAILVDSINDMTAKMKDYINNLSTVTAEKERISTELDLAKNIQEGMLPSIFPTFSSWKEFDLYATMDTAKEVGGDYYDFYKLDENHIAVTIADVSGKGIPAALFMVIAKTVLKNIAIGAASAYANGSEPDFAAVVAQANRQLCENNKETMFVTQFFGVLDIRTGVFCYVNGGHNTPLVGRKSADGITWDYMQIAHRGVIVGVRKNATFVMESLTLAPGDLLYLYTDGVTEAMDEEGNLYGEERLKDTLNRLGNKETIKEILTGVKEDVTTHVGTAEQSDDITMLGLRYLG